MNIITQYITKNNLLPNLIESNNIKDAIDEVTYDQYETSNPLRINFYDYKNVNNKALQTTLKTTQNIGAEVLSAYTNPFYLFHKAINIPTDYRKAVDSYKKHSS